MKKSLFFLALLMLALSLSASEVDDALDKIFSYSSVIEHEGDYVLMTDNFVDNETDAYNWVASISGAVLALRAGWAETPSAYASRINSLDAIGTGWSTEYQTFVVSIPVSEIIDNFDTDSSLEMEMEDLVADILDYVRYYGDVSPLSMY